MKEKVHKTISAICPLFICDWPSYWEPRRWYWDPKRLSKHPVREISPPLRPQVSIFNCAPQVEANPLVLSGLGPGVVGTWWWWGVGGQPAKVPSKLSRSFHPSLHFLHCLVMKESSRENSVSLSHSSFLSWLLCV